MMGVFLGLALFLGELHLYKKKEICFSKEKKDFCRCTEGRYAGEPVSRQYINFDVIIASLIVPFEENENNISTCRCFAMIRFVRGEVRDGLHG